MVGQVLNLSLSVTDRLRTCLTKLLRRTMKKLLPKFALAFTCMLLAAASTTAVPFTFKIQAKIPFDFQIGSKKFPKGEYTIESPTGTSGLMLIRSVKGKKAINFNAVPDKQ